MPSGETAVFNAKITGLETGLDHWQAASEVMLRWSAATTGAPHPRHCNPQPHSPTLRCIWPLQTCRLPHTRPLRTHTLRTHTLLDACSCPNTAEMLVLPIKRPESGEKQSF